MRRRMTYLVSFVVAVLLVVVASSAGAGASASGARSIPLGDYAGSRQSRPAVAQFGYDTGTDPVLATDFLNGSSTWAALDSAERHRGVERLGLPARAGRADPPEPRPGQLGKGARGAYDSYFVTLARNLVADGEGYAFLRLGWEFNGNWYKWSVRNAREPAQYAAYFRDIVDAMRSVPGEAFKFVWNPNGGNSHGRPYIPSQAYPGNAYVDYIGTDLYDESWVSPLTPQNAWVGQLQASCGLDWLATFAADHGKPIVFPEWGVAIRSDGHGLGDDPYFVDQFANWITTHDVAWTNIFSFDGVQQDDITDGSFPNALAAFDADFG